MNPWVIGGGALVLLLIARGAKADVPGYERDATERDLDALANMLITETRFRTNRAEMAQIVWIAINRARKQNKPIWFVVQPGLGPNPIWNTGAPYRAGFERARSDPNWTAARNFASDVIEGSYPNLGKTLFVHPAHANFNMPCNTSIAAVRDGRWKPAYVQGYGTRCIPTWAHKGSVVGTGLFA